MGNGLYHFSKAQEVGDRLGRELENCVDLWSIAPPTIPPTIPIDPIAATDRVNLNTKWTSKNILITRLWVNQPIKLEIKRIDDRTFRIDYQKIVDEKPENKKITPFANSGAYIFEHRNGCWHLIQDLQIIPNS
ncbi:MAG: hypothetical protein NT070_18760 [Cyanobacteria bacterium]|nr:hypothetical protein [Cyanobacteriota bacterium]